MKEIWDAYDKEYQKIENVILERGSEIPDGMFHLACEATVVHTDGTILLMQRDFKKKHGGMWEATAGGSALRGETANECAIRELKEETGIEVSKDNINEKSVVVYEDDKTILVYFVIRINCDKESIILQEGETVAYKWASKEDVLLMGRDELILFGTKSIIEGL